MNTVASFTDAWIETAVTMGFRYLILSRIFYRCVDWNWKMSMTLKSNVVASFTDAWIETKARIMKARKREGRIFYRCVDWNIISALALLSISSHLLQMRGLKPTWSLQVGGNLCRIFYRCVDWNIEENILCQYGRKSHLLQMRGLKP